MGEHAKALHTWLLGLSMLLGVVGESGVITNPAWQKLLVGLAGAIGAFAVRVAAAWQPSEVKAAVAATKTDEPTLPPPHPGSTLRVLLPLAAVLSLTACNGALDKARIATTAAADLGLSSAKFVSDWNDQCEAGAVKLAQDNHVVEAKATAAKCRATYEKLDQAVKTYGAAVASTRAGVELAATMKKLDVGLVLRELLSAGKALKAALDAFGIAIPGIGGLL